MRGDTITPRIVINPSVFNDDKDALCVAFNEAFRVVMELNGFNPVSEPTQKQRRFFADTAYSQDELQMRRTILARIATFDTSVSDPTNEQLQETVEFLNTVLEIGAPQNEFEESAVKQIIEVLTQVEQRGVRSPEDEPEAPSAPDGEGAVQADEGGGNSDDDEQNNSGGQPPADQPPQSDEPDPSVPRNEQTESKDTKTEEPVKPPVEEPSAEPDEPDEPDETPGTDASMAKDEALKNKALKNEALENSALKNEDSDNGALTNAGSDDELLGQHVRNELQGQYGLTKPDSFTDTPTGAGTDKMSSTGSDKTTDADKAPGATAGKNPATGGIPGTGVGTGKAPGADTGRGKSSLSDVFTKLLSDEAINKAAALGALDRIGAHKDQLHSLKSNEKGDMTATVNGKTMAVDSKFLTGGWGGSKKRASGNMRLTEKGTLRSAAERPSGMSEKDFKNASDADLIKFVQDRRAAKMERALKRAKRSGNWNRVHSMLSDKSNRHEFRNDVLSRAVTAHNNARVNARRQLDPSGREIKLKKKGMKS